MEIPTFNEIICQNPIYKVGKGSAALLELDLCGGPGGLTQTFPGASHANSVPSIHPVPSPNRREPLGHLHANLRAHRTEQI